MEKQTWQTHVICKIKKGPIWGSTAVLETSVQHNDELGFQAQLLKQMHCKQSNHCQAGYYNKARRQTKKITCVKESSGAHYGQA